MCCCSEAIGVGGAAGDFVTTNPRAEVPALVDGDVRDSIPRSSWSTSGPLADAALLPRVPQIAPRAHDRRFHDTHYEAINWASAPAFFGRGAGTSADTLRCTPQNRHAWQRRANSAIDWFNGEGWPATSPIPYLNGSAGSISHLRRSLADWMARTNARRRWPGDRAAAAMSGRQRRSTWHGRRARNARARRVQRIPGSPSGMDDPIRRAGCRVDGLEKSNTGSPMNSGGAPAPHGRAPAAAHERTHRSHEMLRTWIATSPLPSNAGTASGSPHRHGRGRGDRALARDAALLGHGPARTVSVPPSDADGRHATSPTAHPSKASRSSSGQCPRLEAVLGDAPDQIAVLPALRLHARRPSLDDAHAATHPAIIAVTDDRVVRSGLALLNAGVPAPSVRPSCRWVANISSAWGRGGTGACTSPSSRRASKPQRARRRRRPRSFLAPVITPRSAGGIHERRGATALWLDLLATSLPIRDGRWCSPPTRATNSATSRASST